MGSDQCPIDLLYRHPRNAVLEFLCFGFFIVLRSSPGNPFQDPDIIIIVYVPLLHIRFAKRPTEDIITYF